MTILLIFGILCIIGAAVLTVMAFLPERLPAVQPQTESGPVTSGGYYVLEVDGMDTDEKATAIETALGHFPALTSEADTEEGTVVIRYKGYPDPNLLDAVKQAVEETGCTVRESE